MRITSGGPGEVAGMSIPESLVFSGARTRRLCRGAAGMACVSILLALVAPVAGCGRDQPVTVAASCTGQDSAPRSAATGPVSIGTPSPAASASADYGPGIYPDGPAPVVAPTGVQPPPDESLPLIRRLCAKYGLVSIRGSSATTEALRTVEAVFDVLPAGKLERLELVLEPFRSEFCVLEDHFWVDRTCSRTGRGIFLDPLPGETAVADVACMHVAYLTDVALSIAMLRAAAWSPLGTDEAAAVKSGSWAAPVPPKDRPADLWAGWTVDRVVVGSMVSHVLGGEPCLPDPDARKKVAQILLARLPRQARIARGSDR